MTTSFHALHEVMPIWDVSVFAMPSHTNPSRQYFVRAHDQRAAIIRAMAVCDVHVGRLTAERADEYADQEGIKYL